MNPTASRAKPGRQEAAARRDTGMARAIDKAERDNEGWSDGKSRKRGGTYISGPMTGLPDFNRVAFLAAEKALRDLGHEPVNPVYNGVPDKAPWHEHMRADIKMLMDCDVIVMLPGWMDSKGAKLEQCIAHWLGMRVVTLEQLRAEGRAA